MLLLHQPHFFQTIRWIELLRKWLFIGTTRQHSSVSDMCQSWHCCRCLSHSASHNDEEHSFDVFIHTAFVYIFTVSSCAHHVKRHCCNSMHQRQPRSMGQSFRWKNIYVYAYYLFPMRLSSTMLFSQCSHKLPTLRGSGVGVGSLEDWWFSQRGETMFCLHELPVNLLIKHANGCNCSWW